MLPSMMMLLRLGSSYYCEAALMMIWRGGHQAAAPQHRSSRDRVSTSRLYLMKLR